MFHSETMHQPVRITFADGTEFVGYVRNMAMQCQQLDVTTFGSPTQQFMQGPQTLDLSVAITAMHHATGELPQDVAEKFAHARAIALGGV